MHSSSFYFEFMDKTEYSQCCLVTVVMDNFLGVNCFIDIFVVRFGEFSSSRQRHTDLVLCDMP